MDERLAETRQPGDWASVSEFLALLGLPIVFRADGLFSSLYIYCARRCF